MRIANFFAKLESVQIKDESEYYSKLPLPQEPNVALKAIAPDNPPWGSGIAFGVWVASIVFIIFFPMLFLVPYFAATGNLGNAEAMASAIRSDPAAVLLQVLAIIPAHVLTLILAYFVVTSNRRYSFKEMLGWEWAGFRWIHAIFISVGFYALAIGATMIFGDVENEFDIMLKSSRYVVYAVAFFAVVTAPIVEEVVYRGLMYSAFQRTIGKIGAILLVTLLFALVHGAQYSKDATPDYAVMTVLLLLSLTLTALRAYSGNLLPCIILHIVFNAFQATLLLAEPWIRPLVEHAETPLEAILK